MKYYIEVNLSCVIMLILLFMNIYRIKEKQYDQHYYALLQIWTIIICLSDMIAGSCRGYTFQGARTLLWLSNMIYCIAILIVSYLWFLYSMSMIFSSKLKYKNQFAIPEILLILFIMLSPIYKTVFTIDENNLYHRQSMMILLWIITWIYLLIPAMISAYKIIKTNNKLTRSQLLPIIEFVLFPTLAGIIQSMFYGITVIQIGITASLLMIGLKQQNSQISLDALTGLNNRGYFNRFLYEKLNETKSPKMLYLIMIDINKFKIINDTFGHVVGDQAIIDVAEILKKICGHANDKTYTARYGGDEFVIFGYDSVPGAAKEMKNLIRNEVKRKNSLSDTPYQLSLSIGFEEGRFTDYLSADDLIIKADRAMYKIKERYSMK